MHASPATHCVWILSLPWSTWSCFPCDEQSYVQFRPFLWVTVMWLIRKCRVSRRAMKHLLFLLSKRLIVWVNPELCKRVSLIFTMIGFELQTFLWVLNALLYDTDHFLQKKNGKLCFWSHPHSIFLGPLSPFVSWDGGWWKIKWRLGLWSWSANSFRRGVDQRKSWGHRVCFLLSNSLRYQCPRAVHLFISFLATKFEGNP